MGKKCTTAGILSTLGILGTGLGLTLKYASAAASQCTSALSAIPAMTASTITIPSISTIADVFIEQANTTYHIPFKIPNISIPLATLLGLSENMKQTLDQLPSNAGNICYAEVLKDGLIITLLLTSIAAFTVSQISCYRALNNKHESLKQDISLLNDDVHPQYKL